MARQPRSVDEAIARFDEVIARYDGGSKPAAAARRRQVGRAAQGVGRKLANMGMAIGALIVATIAFGLFVGPIGWTGLFVVALATLAILMLFSVWPNQPKRVAYSEDVPTPTLLRQLDTLLARERRALPAPAARPIDAISAQLPLLESRLGEMDALDPLAQGRQRDGIPDQSPLAVCQQHPVGGLAGVDRHYQRPCRKLCADQVHRTTSL